MSDDKIRKELDAIEGILQSGLSAAEGYQEDFVQALKTRAQKLEAELKSVNMSMQMLEFFQGLTRSRKMTPLQETELTDDLVVEEYEKEIAKISKMLKEIEAERDALPADSERWVVEQKEIEIKKLKAKLEILYNMNDTFKFIDKGEGALNDLSKSMTLIDCIMEASDRFSTVIPKRARLTEFTSLAIKLLLMKDWEVDPQDNETFRKLKQDAFSAANAIGRHLGGDFSKQLADTGFTVNDVFEENFTFEDMLLALFRLLFKSMQLELPKKIKDSKAQLTDLADQFRGIDEPEEESFDIFVEEIPQEGLYPQPSVSVPVTVPECIIIVNREVRPKEEKLEVIDLDKELERVDKTEKSSGLRGKFSRFKFW